MDRVEGHSMYIRGCAGSLRVDTALHQEVTVNNKHKAGSNHRRCRLADTQSCCSPPQLRTEMKET